MPISEVADRYTIALLKQKNTDEDMSREIALYQDEMRSYPGIEDFVQRLLDINRRIWKLESALRAGKEDETMYAIIAETAIQIRNINRERVSIKNEMVEYYKEGFKDIKINHVSAP
jgi:hypothetical protein